jgi:energy-converting hydrogenase A subunit M
VPRTHRIDELLDAFHDASMPAPPHAESLDELNPYAVQARYGALDVGSLDRALITQWLSDVMNWAESAAGRPPAA